MANLTIRTSYIAMARDIIMHQTEKPLPKSLLEVSSTLGAFKDSSIIKIFLKHITLPHLIVRL